MRIRGQINEHECAGLVVNKVYVLTSASCIEFLTSRNVVIISHGDVNSATMEVQVNLGGSGCWEISNRHGDCRLREFQNMRHVQLQVKVVQNLSGLACSKISVQISSNELKL